MANGTIYEIKRHIGTIAESANGWTKEINVISWNGRPAKIDIRDWAPGHEKAGKGYTLNYCPVCGKKIELEK